MTVIFSPRPTTRASLLAAVSVIALTSQARAGSTPLSLGGGVRLRPNAAAVGAGLASGTGIPAASAARVQDSLAAMGRAAAAIRNAQAAQITARAAAAAIPSTVPNGLAPGGLVPTQGATWQGANQPTQAAGANARQTVTVQQTTKTATLTWTSFNVGRQTDLVFDQSAGGAAANSWSVLNRVADPSANPTRIEGTIRAPGQVLLINRNGVVFSGTSQVNVGALLAATADISDANFRANGIYSRAVNDSGMTKVVSYTSQFGAPGGAIVVQPGALIATNTPASVTQGGGGAILLGSTVQNGGQISTPGGQTVLAAGQIFDLRPGSIPRDPSVTPSTTLYTGVTSTTLGTEIAVSRPLNSTPTPDVVTNTGLIQASTGDITLAGNTITQAGVLSATSSAQQRGTIHLLTGTYVSTLGSYSADPTATIRFGSSSLTQVDVDPAVSTALASQRAGLIPTDNGGFATPVANTSSPFIAENIASADRPDLSRIDVTTGGSVNIGPGALLRSPGGQIVVTANAPTAATRARVLIESGAVLDVSGSLDVVLPASANALQINIQGFELRDAPVNRDTTLLNSIKANVDVTRLTLVRAGTGGYATDRYYTPGGLLEVSGELTNVPHTTGEYTASGGQITIQVDQTIVQPGALLNISGGSVRYLPGNVPTTTLVGTNGRLYSIDTAPANIQYVGVYKGYEIDHQRWGSTEYFGSNKIAATQVFRAGFSVGRNAGTLTLASPTTDFEGAIDATTVVGERQLTAPIPSANTGDSVTNSVLRPSTAVPLGGTVLIKAATTAANSPLSSAGTASAASTVRITNRAAPVAAGVTLTSALPASSLGAQIYSASALTAAELGGLTIIANGTLLIDDDLTLGNGAGVSLTALSTTLSARLTTRGGSVGISDFIPNASDPTRPFRPDGSQQATATTLAAAGLTLSATAVIDTRGLFTNAYADPGTPARTAFVNGGSVGIDVSNAVSLPAGALIDTSSGATVSATGVLSSAGTGGDITIIAYDPAFNQGNLSIPAETPLTLGATFRSVGVGGGGRFSLAVPSIALVATPTADPVLAARAGPTQATIGTAFFGSGFTGYTLVGYQGVTVADGATITPTVPVLQQSSRTLAAPTGSDATTALDMTLPPLYATDPIRAVLTQRKGADFQLSAGTRLTTAPGLSSLTSSVTANVAAPLTIGTGATIAVDPLRMIELNGTGQTTVFGSLLAPSGTVRVLGSVVKPLPKGVNPAGETTIFTIDPTIFGPSIYLGSASRFDVAALSFTDKDRLGKPYGTARLASGGSIILGGLDVSLALGAASTNLFIVARPGSVLEASGTTESIDMTAGTGTGASRGNGLSGVTQISSDGGLISVTSQSGIYLDGTLRAALGGAGASGGTLQITFADPRYARGPTDRIIQAPDRALPRQITLSQVVTPQLSATLSPADQASLVVGTARLGADQIVGAGFDAIALASADTIVFDGTVNLTAGRSISLTTGGIAHTASSGNVTIVAPHVTLGGIPGGGLNQDASYYQSSLTTTVKTVAQVPPPSGTLTVSTALLDFAGFLGVGSNIVVPTANLIGGAPEQSFVRPGFAQLNLNSSGDVRFLASPSGQASGFMSPGDVTIKAAQIYPVSGAKGQIVAGYDPQGPAGTAFRSNGFLNLLRSTTDVPTAPLSVGGSLQFVAGVINQGAILRAPLGRITLGQLDAVAPDVESTVPTPNNALKSLNSSTTFAVNLLPGSLTSVSAAGLAVPVAGTTDGLSYTVLGTTVRVSGVALINIADGLQAALTTRPIVEFLAQSQNIQAGATIDLSGGGTLAGAGFISGRGGSVNALTSPVLRFTSAGSGTANDTKQVFAVIPGFAGYAPITSTGTSAGSAPEVGRTITIATATAGLPAGTYTLLPAEDALLPGAYRVEINRTARPLTTGPIAFGDGSVTTNALLGYRDTGILSALPIQAIISSAATVRRTANYNEQTFTQFAIAQASVLNARRVRIPEDAGTLFIGIAKPTASADIASAAAIPSRNVQTFRDAGQVFFTPGDGGRSGTVAVSAAGDFNVVSMSIPIEVTVDGKTTTTGAIPIRAADLTALNAPTLSIGGFIFEDAQSGQTLSRRFINGLPKDPLGLTSVALASNVTIRTGASVSAGEVVLIAGEGGITIEQGATITTIGRGAPAQDSVGVTYQGGDSTALFVSNRDPNIVLSSSTTVGPIALGSCVLNNCTGSTRLLAEGTIALASASAVTINPMTRFGAAGLLLNVPSINLGSNAALASAQSDGTLPNGFTLSQAQLQTLLNGDPTLGAPRLRRLVLQAGISLNLFGTVDFDTTDPATGQSSLDQFVLNTPAIAGIGTATDRARIITGGLVWNGIAGFTPFTPGRSGPGTGTGAFEIDARQVTLGFAPTDRLPTTVAPSGQEIRRALTGFTTATINATDSIVFNSQTSLSANNLALNTPLLAGVSGGTFLINTTGSLALGSLAGTASVTPGLGATLKLTAGTSLSLGGTVSLPGGRLTLNAANDITFAPTARVDLAGRAISFFDRIVNVPGGTLVAETSAGSIALQPGALIDVSAPADSAGSVSVTARSGTLSVGGGILGAGGPGAAGGSFTARLGSVDFPALEALLEAGGLTGTRAVDVATGDIRVSSVIRARDVQLAADSGTLIVDARIDATGPSPGTIRLSAGNGLTLTSNAILDTHGTVLQVDSYGVPIDASNRGTVELTTTKGILTLASGAVIDVGAPDGVARGQVVLNVPRTSATGALTLIAASGPVTINGASSVALNGVYAYTPRDAAGTVTQTSFNFVTGANTVTGGVVLDTVDMDSQQFIAATIADPGFASRVAGLSGQPGFHLRPGVEIDGGTASGGVVTISGDLDLSLYRYSAGPYGASKVAGQYGSGEPLALTIRAAGTLNVNGSITDGFGPPPEPTGADGISINPDETGFTKRLGHDNGKVSADGKTFTATSQGKIYTTAPLLAFGTLSASIRLVGGADLSSADTRAVLPASASNGGGAIKFDDPHFQQIVTQTNSINTMATTVGVLVRVVTKLQNIDASAKTGPLVKSATQGNAEFSVVRTGTGTLDILSSGSISQASAFGLYTAGTQSAGIDPSFQQPRGLVAQGITYIGNSGSVGALTGTASVLGQTYFSSVPSGPSNGRIFTYTTNVEQYPGYEPLVTGPNYQTYFPVNGGDVLIAAQGDLSGFTTRASLDSSTSPITAIVSNASIGNSIWRQGGAGSALPTAWWINFGSYTPAITPGIRDIVPNSAQNIGNQLPPDPTLTGFTGIGALGGGKVTVNAGGNAGSIDPAESLATTTTRTGALVIVNASTGRVDPISGRLTQTGGGPISLTVAGAINPGQINPSNVRRDDANGVIAAFRGDALIRAGTIGTLTRTAGTQASDLRPPAYTDLNGQANSIGGLVLVPGDGTTTVVTLSDQVLAGTGDPTRGPQANATPLGSAGLALGYTAFSLWQPTTAVVLRSIGGDISLSPANGLGVNDGGNNFEGATFNFKTDPRTIAPPNLQVVTSAGSIFLPLDPGRGTPTPFELSPSASGNLELLAANSVIGQNVIIAISGADPAATATIFRPRFVDLSVARPGASGGINTAALFDDNADTATGTLHVNNPNPSRIYAATGDVIAVQTGQLLTASVSTPQYLAGAPVQLRAGRDVVGPNRSFAAAGTNSIGFDLFYNARPTDVSVVQAGRDIDFLNVDIAGPGSLFVSAGRNITQQDRGSIESIGPSGTSGASIVVAAGLGTAGPDYATFATRYFTPGNVASPAQPLDSAANQGRVAVSYADQLLTYLQTRYGYTGTAAGALAFFQALPTEAQAVFDLPLYFNELRASGREYTNPDSPRARSYVRGRNAVATLFPDNRAYQGDVTLFPAAPSANGTLNPGSLIRTDFGGSVTVLAPGGQLSIGTLTLQTRGGEGILTQGQGDIDIYTRGSVLLGTSRVFTTFGGSIVVWSNQGDINAGRGASSTGTFSPVQVTYDQNGRVALSPSTATTGAGIATLAPLAGIVAGDVDLIAPLGTIDAGEAGIRVSGNLNISALVVSNLANVSVAGTSTGTPVAPTANVTGQLVGTQATGAGTQAANEATRNRDRGAQPSAISVEVTNLGPTCGGPGQAPCR